jgi:cyclopropane fatty-acyl-phospholipid synthase-like methyltransferase
MQLTDRAWVETWSKVRFGPSAEEYAGRLRALAGTIDFSTFGTDDEPGSSLWLASLSSAMGASFRDGMTILDYGCGAGRYAQFMRQRLTRFTYIGVEKPGSASRHGERSIEAAQQIFRDDRRVTFGLIGSETETAAGARADVAVLGSVFTHVDLDELQRIFAKLRPIAMRGGKIVFSIFIDEAYRLEGPGGYGFPDCYGRAWFTHVQLRQASEAIGCVATEAETFVAQQINVHRIFALTRKQGLFGRFAAAFRGD